MYSQKLAPNGSLQDERATRGGVIQEFAIVVPLLTIFFGGLVEAGLYVSQMALAGQTAYQAALVGGKTPQGDRLGAMNARAIELGEVLVKKLDNVTFAPSEQTDERMVSFSYSGTIPTVVPGWNLPLSLSFSAPILLKDSVEVGDLANFNNGQCLYDAQFDEYCDGSYPPDTSGSSSGIPGSDPEYRRDAPEFTVTLHHDGTMSVRQTISTTGVGGSPGDGMGGPGGGPVAFP